MGKVFNFEHRLKIRRSRDLRLNPVGRIFRLLQFRMSKLNSLWRFCIEDGSSTKLRQDSRLSISRLIALERSGITFRLDDPNRSIFFRHVSDYIQQKSNTKFNSKLHMTLSSKNQNNNIRNYIILKTYHNSFPQFM